MSALTDLFDVDDRLDPPAKWVAMAVYIKLPIIIAVAVALAKDAI